MHRGYIKTYRKFIESSFYKKPLVTRLAEHCLLRANHKKQKIYFNHQEIELLPGQFIAGRASLSEETGISQQSIRTSLEILSKVNFLTIKPTSRFSIITIVKYKYYQAAEENQPSDQPATNQQLTSDQPATNQRLTTDKNVKNVKNDKKKELNIFVDTSNEVRLSKKLLNLILEKNQNHKKPDIQSWARHVDLMLRVDKRQVEQIETVIDWCQSDFFWQNNILSTKKLREKFDQLFLKMNNGNGSSASTGFNQF
jgi:hypothetical protein